MSNEPTPAEVERAKKWADYHKWEPVQLRCSGKWEWPYSLLPYRWAEDRHGVGKEYESKDAAYLGMALALRPVFASVGPVVREECAVEAKRVLEADLQFRPSSGMIASGIATVGEEMVNAIRAMS